MTTLANAPDLPSEDEEDDDYVPGADPEADAAAGGKKGKRQRDSSSVADGIAQARASKQTKRVDDIWNQLRSQSGAAASTSAPAAGPSGDGGGGDRQGSAAAAGSSTQDVSRPAGKVSLASVCRPVSRAPKAAVDQSWRKQFGLVPPKSAGPANQQSKQDAKSVAAAAIEAAKALTSADQQGRVTVTETRKFAGQNIQMTKTVAAGSEQKAAAQKAATKGLDAMLAAIQGAKKVTVLDKSQADWREHKKEASDAADLAEHARSNARFVDKQDFLARSELREYEKERDARLNSDVRTRARS